MGKYYRIYSILIHKKRVFYQYKVKFSLITVYQIDKPVLPSHDYCNYFIILNIIEEKVLILAQ